jgi:hypothetical protein
LALSTSAFSVSICACIACSWRMISALLCARLGDAASSAAALAPKKIFFIAIP